MDTENITILLVGIVEGVGNNIPKDVYSTHCWGMQHHGKKTSFMEIYSNSGDPGLIT